MRTAAVRASLALWTMLSATACSSPIPVSGSRLEIPEPTPVTPETQREVQRQRRAGLVSPEVDAALRACLADRNTLRDLRALARGN